MRSMPTSMGPAHSRRSPRSRDLPAREAGAEAIPVRHVGGGAKALVAAARSSSLRSLSRAGIATAGIKYAEGAWPALRDVRRAAQGHNGLQI